jgi:nucleotide-binding universal stress UspA family protein
MRRATRAAVGLLVALGTCAVATAPAGAGDGDPWSALLARVPDTAPYREFVLLNDYEEAKEQIDVQGGDARDKLARLTIDGGISPSELVQAVGRDEDALRDELGIAVAKIDRELTAGNPPDSILVLDGDVDREKVDSATARDDAWSDLRKERSFAGQDYYAWDGEDLHVERITPVRRLGRGGRLAVDPPLAVWTNTDAAMEASLEASAGDERSLADDREISKVVDAVRDADAYAMVLTDQPPSPGVDTGGPQPLLTPSRLALGAAAADGDPELVVVLAQETAADAKENAQRLRSIVEEGTSVVGGRPWSELLRIDDITTEGNLVIGRFGADTPRIWLQAVLARDSLLATE